MVGSLDGTDGQIARLWDRYLADNVQIVHPLLFPDNDSNHESKQGKRNQPPSLDESLAFLQKQDSRGWFGPLEEGLLDENQVLRHGHSNLPGFRGSIVQVFTIENNRIASIYIAKTTAPWKQRFWWFRRKSGHTKQILWQTWWEEWEEEVVQDHQAFADEDFAFQQRLIETNFFVF